MSLSRSSSLLLATLLAGAVTIAAGLCWLARFQSAIQFLPSYRGAEWIVYPTPFSASARPAVELAAKFRKTFVLDGTAPNATLSLRAFKRCSLVLNELPIALPETLRGNWKQPLSVEISKFLHPGENRLEVTVTNDSGPPA